MYTILDLYDLNETYPEVKEYLKGFTYPWEALKGIKELILEIGKNLPSYSFDHPKEDVWIAKDAVVFPTTYIHGPAIIGHNTEVRQAAFIRGAALVGDNCVVGNSSELKNVILFNNVQVPHFNYVGDSILGFHSHMGAGSITSNVRGDKKLVTVHCKDEKIETGIKKIGAMLGDYAEIGCNAVLNPGTIIGRNAQVYPTTCVRGTVPANSICKVTGEIIPKKGE